MNLLKRFGRALGINKGNNAKEEKHEEHKRNREALKGKQKTVFNRLLKRAYNSDTYLTSKGFQTRAEVEQSMPHLKGKTLQNYSGVTKFDKNQDMTQQNKMYDFIFKELGRSMDRHKANMDQIKDRAKRGASGHQKTDKMKKLKISKQKVGSNVSSGTGRYSEAGKHGYQSLKLSGGSNL